jgi:hypothetical protein
VSTTPPESAASAEQEAARAAEAARRAEVGRRVAASLKDAGLECDAYTRLAVAVQLCAMRADGPIDLDLRTAHKELAASLALAPSAARAALRVLRHCGCLLSPDGLPQLAWTGRATDLVSDDPLLLDETCIRFATRAVLHDLPDLLQDEAATAAFRRRIGSWPYTGDTRALSALAS